MLIATTLRSVRPHVRSFMSMLHENKSDRRNFYETSTVRSRSTGLCKLYCIFQLINICIDSQGSFTCGPCHPGFIGDGYLGCNPGDLCTNGSHTCHENAQCTQTGAGRFKCRVGSTFYFFALEKQKNCPKERLVFFFISAQTNSPNFFHSSWPSSRSVIKTKSVLKYTSTRNGDRS